MIRMLVAASLALVASCGVSSAQTYPNRPVRFIVGFGAGGPDMAARELAQQFISQTGKRFIVEDHPGATGEIGAELVAHSKPDGYTLLVTSDSLTDLPSLYKSLPFDVIKDFAPISQLSSNEAAFLVVGASMPVRTAADLVAYARNPKNHLAYGSTGIGGGWHLRAAMFAQHTGVPMVHVPFRSPSEALTALLGGEIQFLFATPSSALPFIKAGKIRALAYDYTSRSHLLPDVPTMTEAGLQPSGVPPGWHGLLAPAKTPRPILDYLAAETRQAFADPAFREEIQNSGSDPVGSSPEEFRKMIIENVAAMHAASAAAGVDAK